MLSAVVRRLRRYYRFVTDRTGYARARLFGMNVPVFPLVYLPDGFSVQPVAQTGLTMVERFCTPDEARHLIAEAGKRLRDSRITIANQQVKNAYRTSKTAVVYDRFIQDPAVVPLLYRAAMLLGLPATHAETVFVTYYSEGEYYKPHEDFYEGFDGDRLYTVLIYLNDLAEDQGGGTVFEHLNIGVKPRLGRAVIWTNTNPDGSHHPETRHEALPVENGGEKWVIQLWFRNYPLIPVAELPPPQATPGVALDGSEPLPDGAWAVGEVEPGSAYARAFG